MQNRIFGRWQHLLLNDILDCNNCQQEIVDQLDLSQSLLATIYNHRASGLVQQVVAKIHQLFIYLIGSN